MSLPLDQMTLIFAGPVCAAVALLVFSIPRARPSILRRWTLGIALAMLVPFILAWVPALAIRFDGLVALAFLSRVLVAPMAGALAVGYLIFWFDRKFPLLTTLPCGLIVAGAVADIYSILEFAPGFGGAYC